MKTLWLEQGDDNRADDPIQRIEVTLRFALGWLRLGPGQIAVSGMDSPPGWQNTELTGHPLLP